VAVLPQGPGHVQYAHGARGDPSHLTTENVTCNDPGLLKGEIARETATACFMGLNTLARYIGLEPVLT
jgi:hypothetical protein